AGTDRCVSGLRLVTLRAPDAVRHDRQEGRPDRRPGGPPGADESPRNPGQEGPSAGVRPGDRSGRDRVLPDRGRVLAGSWQGGVAMKVLYLHGLYSKPGGVKPTFLRQHGHEVTNPALPDDDFSRSVDIARHALGDDRHAVIVGSSRGGAVALNLDPGPVPLVLI